MPARIQVAFAMLPVAAALGFLHGASVFKAEREAAEAARRAREARAAPARPDTGPTLAVPHGTPPNTTRTSEGAAPAAPRHDTTEEDLSAVRASLKEGDEALARGDFAAARAACRAAAERLARTASVAALPLARQAQRGEARAEVLGALAATVPPNDFASGEGLSKVRLKGEGDGSGREYVARVLREKPGEVALRLASGAELTLPAVALAGPPEPCSRDEWRERVARGLAEREERADKESAFELYRLATYALENGLRAEAAPILERALEKDRAGSLVEYFVDAARRPSRATVQLARGGSAAEIASAAPGPGPGPGPDMGAGTGRDAGPEARPDRVHSEPAWRAAIARLEEAIGHYRQSFRGSPNAEQELRAALAILNEVAEGLEKLRDRFPGSRALEAKIIEVNQMRVDCRKRAAAGH